MKILITGGAGFIGSHLIKQFSNAPSGMHQEIVVFDNLSPQIHGANAIEKLVLPENARFVLGDIRDKHQLHAELHGVDTVIHLAAETGTGQSMYKVEKYNAVNIGGTANIFDYIANAPTSRIKKVIVASSRSIYGEGKYECSEHGVVFPSARGIEDLTAGKFEPICPTCARSVALLPTDETAQVSPSSFYGLTKLVQEQMTLLFGKTLGFEAIALRLQNVFGPGQSLSNPYTGLLAVFSNQAREGKEISIFEDGLESRDFVYVTDVAKAFYNAAISTSNNHGSYNIGSGIATSVLTVAELVNKFFGDKSKISVTKAFRVGDIRHAFADISKSRKELGFTPSTSFETGLQYFLEWARDTGNSGSNGDRFERSIQELKERGLYRG